MLRPVFYNPFIGSLLAGVLTALAFPPFSFFPAALIGPVVCFYWWQYLTARQAFFSAWLYSVALLSAGTPWLYFSAIDLAAVGAISGFLLGLLMIAILSLYFAVIGFIYRFLAQKISPFQQALWLFPACWGAGEYLQSTSIMGFPWLALGNAQLDSPLAGWITVFGVYGSSILLALIASLLVWSVQNKRYLVGIVSVTSIVLSGLALQQINWTQATGKTVSIALMQSLFDDNEQSDQDNWQTMLQQTKSAWKNSDLVVWPETQISLFAVRSASKPTQPSADNKVVWQKNLVDIEGHKTEPFWFLDFEEKALTQPLETLANTTNKQVLLGVLLTDNQGDLVHNSVLSLGAGDRAIYAAIQSI